MKKRNFCQECGTRVEMGDNFCPSCGASLTGVSLTGVTKSIRQEVEMSEPDLALQAIKTGENNKRPEEDFPKKFSKSGCPNCGGLERQVLDNVYFCKRCYAEYIRCNKCGMFVDKLNEECPNCGHRLVYGGESYTDNELSFFRRHDLAEYYKNNPFKFFFLFLLIVVACQYFLTREYLKGTLMLAVFMVWRFKWTKKKALTFTSRLIFFFTYVIKICITLAVFIVMYMI